MSLAGSLVNGEHIALRVCKSRRHGEFDIALSFLPHLDKRQCGSDDVLEIDLQEFCLCRQGLWCQDLYLVVPERKRFTFL